MPVSFSLPLLCLKSPRILKKITELGVRLLLARSPLPGQYDKVGFMVGEVILGLPLVVLLISWITPYQSTYA